MSTIHEVAKAAGVSISTVSYALSGKRPISPKTRERIDEAVRELGYSPNAGARMLAGRRTQIFAVSEPLHEHTHAPTHMAFVLATSVAARRSDYDILLLTDEESRRGMRRVTDSGLVDAILVFDVAPDDERVSLARTLNVPVIFVGIPDDNTDITCLDFDFEGAAAKVADAFIDEGHTNLAMIGHPSAQYDLSNFPPRARDGFIARAKQRGASVHFQPLSGSGSLGEQASAAVDDALASGATALALHNGSDAHDLILAEISRRGLSVPGDISVASIAPMKSVDARSVTLTSTPLDPQASCDLAVSLALNEIAHPETNRTQHLISADLVDNGTISKPRA